MTEIDKNTFFDITQTFDYVPFTQSEGCWKMNSIKGENRFQFFVDSLEKPSLACMGYVMKRFGLKMLQIDGECFADGKNIDSKKIRDFYKEITQADFDIIEINSSLPYDVLYEIGVREAGYLRPVGMFSSQLSNWIDLHSEIRYNENWKRNLKKSEKLNLKLNVLEQPTNDQIRFFSDFYNKFAYSKGFGHHINFEQTKALLQSNDFSLALVTDETENILAGIIFHHRNNRAGLYISARSTEYKNDNGVTFFMYDQLFKYLKSKGYTIFDLEKLCPSTHSKQSVFLFKNGIKGEKVLYCGEFSWYKRQIYRPLMYFVKKYLFKRVEV